MIETIRDLIKELQKYPPDAFIFDLYGDPFEKIEYRDEIFLGDPANPNCKTTDGFKLI